MLFISYLLSAIRVVSSPYLKLLIFFPVMFIPGCEISSLAFCVIYFAYKLNKQGHDKNFTHKKAQYSAPSDNYFLESILNFTLMSISFCIYILLMFTVFTKYPTLFF